MNKTIRKELTEAKKSYQLGEYETAESIYKRIYENSPKELEKWDKIRYCWTLYKKYIKNAENMEDMVKSVKLISELVKQEDTKNNGICVYTVSIIKIMGCYYKKEDYDNVLYWSNKLNVDLLDDQPYEYKNYSGEMSILPSKKENWYVQTSKSFLKVYDFDMAIKISKEALKNLDSFSYNNEIWFKWRIAKSNREIGEYDEALKYLKDIGNYKKDWFIQKEIAENYFFKEDYENSLKYAIDAALNKGDIDLKLNLYSLLEDILFAKGLKEYALKHAYLTYSIRLNKDWTIDDELKNKLEEGNFDIDNNQYWKIEKDLNKYWQEVKYSNQAINYGVITKILPHGKAGFIKSDDGNSYYFNNYEFKGDKDSIIEGTYVSFYLDEGFDYKKNEKTVNASNIKVGIN